MFPADAVHSLMAGDIVVNKHVSIPHSELRFKFARSGGRGGQNVNKVETKVELLFDVSHSPSLSESERDRIMHHVKSRIDDTGVLRVVSQDSRSQWKNRADAVEKFQALLRDALRPRRKRIATKISAGANERRLERKKHRSRLKDQRRELE